LRYAFGSLNFLEHAFHEIGTKLTRASGEHGRVFGRDVQLLLLIVLSVRLRKT